MIQFLLAALAVNGAAAGGVYFGRRFLLRMPMPGIWLLAIVLAAILLTLRAAEATFT